MNTLFILSIMREYGGAEQSIATLIPHFAKAARVFVFVENERHGAALRALESPQLTVVSVPKGNGPWVMLRTLILLRYYCAAERPQALLANGHKGSLLLFLLRAFIPGPPPQFAVYVRDFDYYTFRYTLWAMRNFLFFAPTRAIFEHPAYLAWGLTRLRHEVIANAVVAPREVAIVEGTTARYIGCCARITPWKGIEYLIRAFAIVAKSDSAARLRIYGEVIDADYYDSLTALVSELKLSEQLAFHPFTSDLSRLYHDGLFFVVPSLSIPPGPESFCRIIIEAWSLERPVIAFAAGGPRCLIEDGTDGFLVEERNTENLAARMGELLRDPGLRNRMGAAGKQKVRTQFDPEKIAGAIQNRLFAKPMPSAGFPIAASAVN